VGQTLPIKTHLEAALANQTAVMGDGLKMLPCFHAPASEKIAAAIIYHSPRKCKGTNSGLSTFGRNGQWTMDNGQ
jgi:hypothetical protein